MKLIVKAKDWYANLTVTTIEKEENVVFAYNKGVFVGFSDLGTVDALYVSGEQEGA